MTTNQWQNFKKVKRYKDQRKDIVWKKVVNYFEISKEVDNENFHIFYKIDEFIRRRSLSTVCATIDLSIRAKFLKQKPHYPIILKSFKTGWNFIREGFSDKF